MKLNPDCIRDILISVELETSLNTHIRFTPGKMPSTLAQYSDDVIFYHVKQCELSDLFGGKHTGFSMVDAWCNISHHQVTSFFLIFVRITIGAKPKKLQIRWVLNPFQPSRILLPVLFLL